MCVHLTPDSSPGWLLERCRYSQLLCWWPSGVWPTLPGSKVSPSLLPSPPAHPYSPHRKQVASQWWPGPWKEQGRPAQVDQPQVLPAKLRLQALVLCSSQLHVQAQCWVGGGNCQYSLKLSILCRKWWLCYFLVLQLISQSSIVLWFIITCVKWKPEDEAYTLPCWR